MNCPIRKDQSHPLGQNVTMDSAKSKYHHEKPKSQTTDQPHQGTKIFQYYTCPAGRVTYNFHLSCKHMHMSFKSVCNKELKGVISNTTSSSNSSQRTRPVGRVFGEELLFLSRFTCNYEQTSGIFVPYSA